MSSLFKFTDQNDMRVYACSKWPTPGFDTPVNSEERRILVGMGIDKKRFWYRDRSQWDYGRVGWFLNFDKTARGLLMTMRDCRRE